MGAERSRLTGEPGRAIIWLGMGVFTGRYVAPPPATKHVDWEIAMCSKSWVAGLCVLLVCGACVSCAAEPKATKPSIFEGYSLPYRGNADVSVIDGGWLIIGLEPANARPITGPEEEWIPDRDWFFLVPTDNNLELVQCGGRTWLVPQAHAAAAAARLGPGTTRKAVPEWGGACARETVAAFSGTARLLRNADGSCRLSLVDTHGKECFTASFRVTAPSGSRESDTHETGMSQEQSSSCDVECEHGSCSITCIGKMALCDCHNGDPYCRCGRKLRMEVMEPVLP